MEQRYQAYLRRRIEERPGPRLRPGFPAGREALLALIAPRPLRLLLPDEPQALAQKVYSLYGKSLPPAHP